MKLLDFYCENCDNTFEDLVANLEVKNTPCPDCSKEAVKVMSVPNLGKFSMQGLEGRTEMLKKRSLNHSQKTMKDNFERIGINSFNKTGKLNLSNKKK